MSDQTIFCALVSISAAKFAALIVCRKAKLNKFEKVGTVKSINLFPFKSAGPIHLQSALCTPVGLNHENLTDRTWMVIRPNGSCLTARLDPKLVLIKPSSDGDNLRLQAPGMPDLVLPKFPEINTNSKFFKCGIFGEYITGLHCGDGADQWFRKFLENEAEGATVVVSTSSMEKRDTGYTYRRWGNPAKPGDITTFSDIGPYMILSEASVEDLNTRLERKVTMLRFRPNIAITGCSPYDEDNWSEMRIGDKVYMRLLDFCGRCSFTQVDPDKGVKDLKLKQPFETLKSYRFRKDYDAPVFGVNAAIDTEGEIKVGDPVYVIRKQ